MAQRLIHQLFAEKLIEDGAGVLIRDPGRFLFGSLLPDAYRERESAGDIRRDAQIATHYKRATPDMLYRYFDYAQFYRDFRSLIMTDDMYLGYYIHIVEDVYHRYFIHTVKGMPRAAVPELREAVYRDYHLLNAYIMKKYGLRQRISKPGGFENEAINSLYPFDPDRMLAELEGDYNDPAQGVPTFHTPESLDEFFEGYVPLCAEAIRLAREGQEPPDPLERKWSAGDSKDYL